MFEVKDSGERKHFESGMVRDTDTNKIDYARVLDGPMFQRWAEHLTKGAKKYPDTKPGSPNWMKARGEEEYYRFKQSALRHFIQWFTDQEDEDHASATFFNMNGAEYIKWRRGLGKEWGLRVSTKPIQGARIFTKYPGAW